eukprot:1639727-Heterocapsa_arctica.AAC.1
MPPAKEKGKRRAKLCPVRGNALSFWFVAKRSRVSEKLRSGPLKRKRGTRLSVSWREPGSGSTELASWPGLTGTPALPA